MIKIPLDVLRYRERAGDLSLSWSEVKAALFLFLIKEKGG